VLGTWRTIRIGVAAAGGIGVAAALAASGTAPAGQAPIDRITEGAVNEGGGKNVVNVILTDLRALDTLGEVVVLATVAIGILALAKVRRQETAA
jgi:multisubunit Na+/H+ antiporter MnhB subunit